MGSSRASEALEPVTSRYMWVCVPEILPGRNAISANIKLKTIFLSVGPLELEQEGGGGGGANKSNKGNIATSSNVAIDLWRHAEFCESFRIKTKMTKTDWTQKLTERKLMKSGHPRNAVFVDKVFYVRLKLHGNTTSVQTFLKITTERFALCSEEEEKWKYSFRWESPDSSKWYVLATSQLPFLVERICFVSRDQDCVKKIGARVRCNPFALPSCDKSLWYHHRYTTTGIPHKICWRFVGLRDNV